MAVASLASCRRAILPPEPEHADELAALTLLPAETQIVLSLDLDRLRSQPVWNTLSSVLAKHAGPAFDEIAAGIGLEPARQIHRLWVALPGERQTDGRFVLVADSEPMDTGRATTWLRRRAQDQLSVVLPTPKRIVVSKGAWANNTAMHPPRSAADNNELRQLCQRAAGAHSAWFAAIVPTALRHALTSDDRFRDVATMVRVFGFVNDTAGLHAEVVGEFGNTSDPPQIAHRLEILHNQAKRDPDMLVAGLSPYLQALHVNAHDAHIRIAIDLPNEQAGDVVERIEALARTARTK